MSNKHLNVGLIGAGLQGRRRAQALRLEAGDRLVAVSDVNAAAGQKLAASYQAAFEADWQRVAANPTVDVVVVCTPSHLHYEMVKAALEAGKHVLCEKPLTLTAAESEELIALAEQKNLRIKCGFNHRHFPGVAQAKLWCDQGKLGEILMIRARHGICGRPGYEKDWRAQAQQSGGGELMDQGFHCIDLFRWFMGEFDQALGHIATSFWPIQPLEDNAFALFKTSKGKIASLHNSWTQWKNLFSFEVLGTEGGLEVEGLGGSYGTQKLRFYPKSFDRPFFDDVIEYRGEDTSFKSEWKEFAAALEEGREPLGNGRDGLEALKLVLGVYQSARDNAAIQTQGEKVHVKN